MNVSAIDKLAQISDLLKALGTAIAELASPKEEEPEAEPEAEPKAEPKAVAEPAAVAAPLLKLEDVRAVLGDIARTGKSAEMKALLRKYGANKLSDIPAEKYPELLKEAEAVRDA